MEKEHDPLRKLDGKELIEFIWNLRGDLYLLVNELERWAEKNETKKQ